MPTTDADPITVNRTTAIRLLVGNVLIWFFWATGDRFGAHGHPHISDAFCFLFYISLTAETAAIIDGFVRRRRLTISVFVLLSIASAVLAFASSPWPTFAGDVRAALPVAASIATAIVCYRLFRRMKNIAVGHQLEMRSLRDELEKSKQEARDAAKALHAKFLPRLITEKQKLAICEKLKPLGPQDLDLVVSGNAIEVITFTNMLDEAISLAGWRTRRWIGKTGDGWSGVWISVRKNAEVSTGPAAIALAEAMNLAGISFDWKEQFGNEIAGSVTASPWDGKSAMIRLHVGEKPVEDKADGVPSRPPWL